MSSPRLTPLVTHLLMILLELIYSPRPPKNNWLNPNNDCDPSRQVPVPDRLFYRVSSGWFQRFLPRNSKDPETYTYENWLLSLIGNWHVRLPVTKGYDPTVHGATGPSHSGPEPRLSVNVVRF